MSSFLKHPGNFHCSLWRNTVSESSAQLSLVCPCVKQMEFCSISNAVNKECPLKLGACLSVLRSSLFIFQAECQLNAILVQRREFALWHLPVYNSNTCLVEFPSYSLMARKKMKEKKKEQVLLINHADNLQEVLFSFYVRNLNWVWFSAYWSFFSCVHSKGPTYEDILSIYALYTVCVYIHTYVYMYILKY